MKKILNSTLVLMVTLVLFSCTEDGFNLKGYPDSVINDDPPGSPPRGLKENWNGHSDVLNRKYFDTYLAVYYGNEVNREIEWPYAFISDSWKSVINNYGDFGDEGSRLYAVIHEDLSSESYISTYFDEVSNFQSLIDISLEGAEIDTNNKDRIVFLIENLVESSVKGVKGAIGKELWKDQFAKIFAYDIYKDMGLDADAQRIYDAAIAEEVSYPSANIFWFRDWFLPLYENYNGSVIFSNFFKLLSEKYPLTGNSYSRDLNLGEMIHFFSGATGEDLQPLAEIAFGWNDVYEELLFQAKAKFPDLNYPFDPVTEVIDVTNQGVLSVSRDNNGGPSHKEGSPKVIDASVDSKFLVDKYPNEPIWIQLQYAEPVAISQYSISSANDAPDRDPRKWELTGSKDGINWVSLHTKENEAFSGRKQTKTYSFSNEEEYSFYRLHIHENGGSSLMQVSEIRFFSIQEIRELDYTGDATLTVSTENINGSDGAEGSLKAVDGDVETKFLVDFSGSLWMQQELAEAKVITRYTITSADSAVDRDLKTWEFQASNDGSAWETLDTQTDQSFPNRRQTITFPISNNTEYLYYRISISENNGGSSIQLSEWRLIGPR
ncbi:discoidin domain-containing protein [Mariniflexile litorale]|uniref:Discoidin domain-containing protein n=1 Tax=Mariniflexile litorale TaxID=3045158 RepID=A0AAU7EI59_9FLAO|nr:discoidin domain-containing protein [Mariniflexile sp. KMM 9835]MDQ8211953.1 discoidin domain-containing protein [Mariniflexile sp. KMM 9835]